jgi:para-aminobenzoate synthetase/4-amino-4-deoxychorismate lyase
LTYSSDRQQAAWLSHSEKNRAENVMIVDMIRNDLGKIARTGTVNVTQLFNLEPYPTLWQMTSSVSCQTTAPLPEIMRSLFPCASITGAPKPQTMQIIAELEDTPRRIYTGAIGFIAPERRSQFSVAIRTVLIDKTQQRAEYGVGGGIVWDSTAAAEFEECCTKAKVLTQPPPEFSLLETLLWTAESNYFLLDLHLQRLSDSASYFSFPIDVEEIRRQLMQITEQMTSDRYKVRLLVSRQGDLTCDWQPLAKPSKEPLRITISPAPIDSNHVFLYHKTTHRQVYQQAQRSHPDFDDVLLWNEKGELTESCIANLVVELEGQYYTPPVSCGLLAGTMRSSLLEQGMIQERVILLQELQQCSRIFLVNSVRQMREAIVF